MAHHATPMVWPQRLLWQTNQMQHKPGSMRASASLVPMPIQRAHRILHPQLSCSNFNVALPLVLAESVQLPVGRVGASGGSMGGIHIAFEIASMAAVLFSVLLCSQQARTHASSAPLATSLLHATRYMSVAL